MSPYSVSKRLYNTEGDGPSCPCTHAAEDETESIAPTNAYRIPGIPTLETIFEMTPNHGRLLGMLFVDILLDLPFGKLI